MSKDELSKTKNDGWEDPARARRWVDAGIALGHSSNARVLCPDCGQAELEVLDVREGERLDRYLSCPKCKKHSVLSNVDAPPALQKEPKS